MAGGPSGTFPWESRGIRSPTPRDPRRSPKSPFVEGPYRPVRALGPTLTTAPARRGPVCAARPGLRPSWRPIVPGNWPHRFFRRCPGSLGGSNHGGVVLAPCLPLPTFGEPGTWRSGTISSSKEDYERQREDREKGRSTRSSKEREREPSVDDFKDYLRRRGKMPYEEAE